MWPDQLEGIASIVLGLPGLYRLGRLLLQQVSLDVERVAVTDRPHRESSRVDRVDWIVRNGLFHFVVIWLQPGGPLDLDGGIATGVTDSFDIALISGQSGHVPHQNLALGVTENEDGVLSMGVVQAEAQEELWPALRSFELQQSHPQARARRRVD